MPPFHAHSTPCYTSPSPNGHTPPRLVTSTTLAGYPPCVLHTHMMPPQGWGTHHSLSGPTAPKDKDNLSVIQKAALCGFAGMLISELEEVWASLQEISKAGDIHRHIYSVMDTSKEDLHIFEGRHDNLSSGGSNNERCSIL